MKIWSYEQIREDLINEIQSTASFSGDILENSTIMKLIEAFAEKLTEFAAYNEYLTRESKWSMARNLSSIMTQAELFGYKVHRMIGSSGYITVSASQSFNEAYKNNIVIPKFSRFSNGEYTYISDKEVILHSNEKSVKVHVIQGELQTLKFSGNNTDYFTKNIVSINENNVENSVYELTNNGILCIEVNNWLDSGDVNFEFKVKNNYDFSGIKLEFYPDSHDENDNFEFKYITTDGDLGDCLNYNAITTVLDSFTDTQGYFVKLYCTNLKDAERDGQITGGSSYETIDSIKMNAPYMFNRWGVTNSQDSTFSGKLITREDYLSFFKKAIPSSIIQVWTDYDDKSLQEMTNYDFLNNCKISVVGLIYDGNTRRLYKNRINTELYLSFLDDIVNHKGLTDYFSFLNDSKIYNFYFNGNIYYDTEYITEEKLKTLVANYIISKLFYDEETKLLSDFLQFNNKLYGSNVITFIQSSGQIRYVNADLVVYIRLEFQSTFSTDESHQLNEILTSELISFNSLGGNENAYINGQYYYLTTREPEDSLTRRLVEDFIRFHYNSTVNWIFEVKKYEAFISAIEAKRAEESGIQIYELNAGKYVMTTVDISSLKTYYQEIWETVNDIIFENDTETISIVDNTLHKIKINNFIALDWVKIKEMILTTDTIAESGKIYYELVSDKYEIYTISPSTPLPEGKELYEYRVPVDTEEVKLYDIVLRFNTYNNNAVTNDFNEILSITDASQEGESKLGVINPWIKNVGDEEAWINKGLSFKAVEEK